MVCFVCSKLPRSLRVSILYFFVFFWGKFIDFFLWVLIVKGGFAGWFLREKESWDF